MILDSMQLVRDVCREGHQQRDKAQVKTRQPLASVIISHPRVLDILHPQLLEIIADELQVHEVKIPLKLDDIEATLVYVSSLGFSGYNEGLFLDD